MPFKADYFGTDFQIRFNQREHALLLDMLATRINSMCGRLFKRYRNDLYDLPGEQIVNRLAQKDRKLDELFNLFKGMDGDLDLIAFIKKNR